MSTSEFKGAVPSPMLSSWAINGTGDQHSSVRCTPTVHIKKGVEKLTRRCGSTP